MGLMSPAVSSWTGDRKGARSPLQPQINSSPELAERVQGLLTDAGIEAKLKPDLEWSASS